MDEFVVHQISKVHTAAFVDLLGIDPKKVLTVFPELGNIGPASVPIALSRSEEHTSELQSLMRISYAVFCLKKKKEDRTDHVNTTVYYTTTEFIYCIDIA